MTLPIFMLLTYDRVLNARSVETLTALVLMAFACLVTMGILDYARRRTLALFGAALQVQLERDLLEVSQADRITGRAHGNVMGELDRIRAFIHSEHAVRALYGVWVPLFVGVVFVLNATLGWIAVLGIAVVAAIFAVGQVLNQPSRGEGKRAWEALNELSGALRRTRDRLGGLHSAPAYLNRWLKLRHASREAAVAAKDRSVAFETLTSTVHYATSVTILAVGAVLVLNDLLTVGAMIAAVIMVNRIMSPSIQFLRALPMLTMARDNWRALGAHFAIHRSPPPKPVPTLMLADAPVVTARRLR
ncbi:MAG: hypothetical protein ACRC6I_10380, partial [Paracoccaceae bacterium]